LSTKIQKDGDTKMSCGKCMEPLSERLQSRKLWVSILAMVIILLLLVVGGHFALETSLLNTAIQSIAVLGTGYSVSQAIADKK
jgi:small-conductance mechanosensitive channel